MADILKPDRNSHENILLFINTIEDEQIKKVMIDNLEHILLAGADCENKKVHYLT